ncbi:hypothetical protein [Micromonospora endophytica]|uniref:hypothetical protein n=1 Tax=Micromonospora endophytica TaxID=515350 RepID=UPI0011B3BB35|nr:hypothetical protein [Micromonospora endophytica]
MPPATVPEPDGDVVSPAVPGSLGTGSPVTDAGSPMTDEQLRQEEFLRQQAANKAFRQRGNLDPLAADGARSCASEVSQSLNLLTAGGRDEPDEESVQQALAATGLTDVIVRPPGRLDLGPGDGLIFAGWTGQACVYGSVRRADITVEIGTPCLLYTSPSPRD